MENNRGRFSHMKPDTSYKSAFMDFCQMLRKLWKTRGELAWPALLQLPLDGLMLAHLKSFRQT